MHALDSAWKTVCDEFDAGQRQSALAARFSLLHALNQLLRRLRRYEEEAEWASTTLDAAASFASRIALFAVRAGNLVLLGERNLSLAPSLVIPSQSGGAFAHAIAAKDTVVAMRTASEVGEALASTDPGERACIVPISNRDRVVSVLFAPSGTGENNVDALELVAGLASIVLERQSNITLHTQIQQAQMEETQLQPPPANATVPIARTTLPSWSNLDEKERAQHIRAQRFSRVKVAEMQLYKPEACRQGREQGNLYLLLRPEIDTARDTYRSQFMTTPTMVDYLHLELVKTATAGDELKLGAEYPGPLY